MELYERFHNSYLHNSLQCALIPVLVKLLTGSCFAFFTTLHCSSMIIEISTAVYSRTFIGTHRNANDDREDVVASSHHISFSICMAMTTTSTTVSNRTNRNF